MRTWPQCLQSVRLQECTAAVSTKCYTADVHNCCVYRVLDSKNAWLHCLQTLTALKANISSSDHRHSLLLKLSMKALVTDIDSSDD